MSPSVADRIVAEARTWIGTPYHNCGDVKGAGVDCGMLLVRVVVDLGLVPAFDPRPYPSDWHLHRSEERYLANVLRYCDEAEKPARGDVVVFRYGRCFSHGGFITAVAPLTILHAWAQAELVFEEPIVRNSMLTERLPLARYFRLKG